MPSKKELRRQLKLIREFFADLEDVNNMARELLKYRQNTDAEVVLHGAHFAKAMAGRLLSLGKSIRREEESRARDAMWKESSRMKGY